MHISGAEMKPIEDEREDEERDEDNAGRQYSGAAYQIMLSDMAERDTDEAD